MGKLQTSKKIVALVPMRHHSERVEGKNYRTFAGKPLYHHILSRLSDSSAVDRIVVDTDSDIIKSGIGNNFEHVTVIDRPEHLRSGEIPMNEILLHDTEQVPADFYLQTHSTNPLLKTVTIAEAIDTYVEHFPRYDSLFSVTRIQTRLWDSLTRPVNHNPDILLRTQDLPPLFEENSCIYLFTRKILKEYHNRIGQRPYMFEVAADEAVDIDEELDFTIAEQLYKQKNA